MKERKENRTSQEERDHERGSCVTKQHVLNTVITSTTKRFSSDEKEGKPNDFFSNEFRNNSFNAQSTM
jgi:hypothetical protein